jgi:hypothetical protein
MKICVKTQDGQILPVIYGTKFSEKDIVVRTEREANQGSWMFKFVGGPNDFYTMLCDEQGEEVSL